MKCKSKQITTIIFDLGNVIIDFDHTRAFRKLVKYSPFTVNEMRARISGALFIKAYEKGRISDKAFFERFKNKLKLKISRVKFEKIWSNIFSKNKQMENLVKNVKKSGYRVAILSDTNPLHDRREVSKFPIKEISHRYFTSFALKARKAEGPKVFKIVLKKLKVNPTKVLFIDDLPRNVVFARKAGIKSILFKGLGQLRKAFNREGLKL